jgi:hypothetical protein
VNLEVAGSGSDYLHMQTVFNANRRSHRGKIIMKAMWKFMAVATLALGMGATVMPGTASAQWSQAWLESGVGSFDAIGVSWVSGGTFSDPALTFDSGTTGWTAIGNALNSFATFDATTSLYFSNHLLSAPGTFVFYAWNGDTLVDSALVDTGLNIQSPYLNGAPTRAEQMSMSAPVPEPDTYAMLLAGLGLMGFIARRRKQQEAA